VVGFTQTVVAKLTSGSPKPVTLVPALSEMPGGTGWTLDPNPLDPADPKTATGPAVASNEADAIYLIDGSAAPFFVQGGYQALGLAWERWVKGDYSMELRVWQMASVADATKLYTDLLSNSLYSNVTWTTCAGTDPAKPCQ
jgi:hypothetical protein